MNLIQHASMGEALYEALTRHPDHVGLIEYQRDRVQARFTYQDILSGAMRVRGLLHDHGMKPKAHCGIIMSNQSKLNISAMAIFFGGGVLVPIDFKLTPQEQIALIQHAQLTHLIIEYPLYARFEKANLTSSLPDVTVVSEAPEHKDVGSALRWESPSQQSFDHIVSQKPSDVATIVYSSGTFGQVKGCMMTHANYLHQGQALVELFPVDQRHTYFSFIPTNHAIDFMCGFFLPIVSQSKTVHQRTLRPEFIAHTIRDAKITHMAMVPMLLDNLYKKIRADLETRSWLARIWIQFMMFLNKMLTQSKPRHALSRLLLWPIHKKFGGHLQYIFVGGAFANPTVVSFFYNLGFGVSVGYGLTEAGTVLTVNDLQPFRADTVGKPLSITQVEIRNANEDGVGHVFAKGPTVMKGYFQNDTLTQQTIQDGWLDTGDVGYFDGGHLILKGRHKNMIVTSGGKNIYPEDIEPYFQELDVEEYCVFSGSYLFTSDETYRDDLILVTYRSSSLNPTQTTQNIQRINSKLSEHKRIGRWIAWDQEFPKTATLKIKRPKLAHQIQERSNTLEVKTLR